MSGLAHFQPFTFVATNSSINALNTTEVKSMKVPSASWRKWHRLRARNQLRRTSEYMARIARNRVRHQVTLWLGDSTEIATSRTLPTAPPEVLCFRTNRLETVRFFHEWRIRTTPKARIADAEVKPWISRRRGKSRRRSISGYVDYANIEEISTAAAVVIAADYDRLATIKSEAPPTVNLHKWSDPVFNKLLELGFFEIVGLVDSIPDRYIDDGLTRTMSIISGRDASQLEEAARHLKNLALLVRDGEIFDEELELAINTALSEAMANVARHAYPDGHHFRFRHVSKWWVTAAADRPNRKLTIVIYDQGASIPVTFTGRKMSERAKSAFMRVFQGDSAFDFDNDSAYILGAMQRGNTQTTEPNRGLGLSNMKDLIDICGMGRLTIFSRGGVCEYADGTETYWPSLPYSIGGTLIEWTIQLPGGRDGA